MDITIKCDTVEVAKDAFHSSYDLKVQLGGIDHDDLLESVDIDDFVKFHSVDDILYEIDIDEIKRFVSENE